MRQSRKRASACSGCEGRMRTLLAGLVFVLVFGAVASPFVFYQMAERSGDVARLSGLATGIFAAVSGTVGWIAARMAFRTISDTNIPEIPGSSMPRPPANPRKRAIQILFVGLTVAFLSFGLQHYPIYRDLPLSWRALNDIRNFFHDGWGIYAGGLLALWGAYRLVREPK